MKVSKIFGCVLGLHACLIAVLIVQPGCQSTQPPTQTYTQDRAIKSSVQDAAKGGDGLIEATPGDELSLDPAFNAGFDDERYAPRGDFREFDSVEPLEPLTNASGPTVDVVESSFETYTVESGDSLWAISKRYSVSLNDLYEANALNENSVLSIGQQIQIPVEGSRAAVTTVTPDSYQPTTFNQGSTDYTVERGDTLSRIASRFDTTVGAIKATNGKSSDMIRVGEKLVIPVGNNASVPSSATSSSAVPTSSPLGSESGTHVVRAGEYPATIARQYGMTTSELLAVNGIADPRKLQVGQRLKVNTAGSMAGVDINTETVVETAPAPPSPPVPAPETIPAQGPVEMTVIEADPLIEGEFEAVAEEDDPFSDAATIPVIRLNE